MSPYAVTKLANELYANVFAKTYEFKTIGLRYFNIFGKRQDPNSTYAAVIPKWVAAILNGDDVFINGDGRTSRDFCYVDNAVQINILAAMTENDEQTKFIMLLLTTIPVSMNFIELLNQDLLKELMD